jgi:hypothetical protein
MKCKRGIAINNGSQVVPCGQCMPCRINKGRLWTSRIMMEVVTNPGMSWFVTLTYDDDHIPFTAGPLGEPVPTLERKTFREWLEATRRKIGAYRYYAVGEYGDLSGRPHYHMALFPESHVQVSQLQANWKLGFTQVSEMVDERARYLARYTAKKLTDPTDERLLGQEPEFRLSSRHPPLGSEFVKRMVEHYEQPRYKKLLDERGDVERTYRIGSRVYPIGQWPLKKIREGLGIPLLHRERIVANPNYLTFHETEEAEWNPIEAEQQRRNIDAQTRRRLHRSESIKI